MAKRTYPRFSAASRAAIPSARGRLGKVGDRYSSGKEASTYGALLQIRRRRGYCAPYADSKSDADPMTVQLNS
jgi:hypothetical protein